MKISIYHIIFTLSLAITAPSGIVCINAQDAGYFNEGSNDADGDTKERSQYSPGGEGESMTSGATRVHTPILSRDSARTSPIRTLAVPSTSNADANKGAARQNEEDDSVLSFNFLYYIIRKYKLQDIMD
ncbi:hypothetical protein KK062_01130 [Fulvivirgaceae bacterium PWU5]|uniref:Uncharacterized protein n=1 Tax=Dawidia cretensis TaxID=2782350 RepID=A0AAP2DSU7_9BACT|nr:hypothetical protein [Dawidia cretensis]MBT1706801.1 hypothetical protein [Dawidia cretensis]